MPTASSAEVLWARHGQNEANLTRQFSHRRLDLNLTAQGREQAEHLAVRLAARLGNHQPSVLVASPLRRARQSAEIVARRVGGDFQLLDGLREVNVGELDGRGDPAAWRTYESVLEGWRSGQPHLRFPGGENWYELCTRLREALLDVAAQAHGHTAVVIAHGANLRATLPGLAGVEDPGVDLATGEFADLEVTTTPAAHPVRVLAWRPPTPA